MEHLVALDFDTPSGATIFDRQGRVYSKEAGGTVDTTTEKFVYGGRSLKITGPGRISTTSSSFAIGLSDFTVQTWAFVTGTSQYKYLFELSGSNKMYIRFADSAATSALQFAVNEAGSWENVFSCEETCYTLANAWFHVRLVRKSGICSFFVNGKRQMLRTGPSGSSYPYAFANLAHSLQSTKLSLGALSDIYLDSFSFSPFAISEDEFDPPVIPDWANIEIAGNVTTTSGAAADKVIIFSWDGSKVLATATPNASGSWAALVPPGTEFGISYIANGMQPLTHGPYIVSN